MAPATRRDRAEMSSLLKPTDATSTDTALRKMAVMSAGVTQDHFPL